MASIVWPKQHIAVTQPLAVSLSAPQTQLVVGGRPQTQLVVGNSTSEPISITFPYVPVYVPIRSKTHLRKWKQGAPGRTNTNSSHRFTAAETKRPLRYYWEVCKSFTYGQLFAFFKTRTRGGAFVADFGFLHSRSWAELLSCTSFVQTLPAFLCVPKWKLTNTACVPSRSVLEIDHFHTFLYVPHRKSQQKVS